LEMTGSKRVGWRLRAAASNESVWRSRGLGFAAVFAVLGASRALGSGAAVAKKTDNHCISPAGDDLNQVFGTPDAFVAPFCIYSAPEQGRRACHLAVARED
jgi:hypothetical protein